MDAFSKPILVIAGPTASGKTALSIKAAKALNGEILSADSMQIYRGMDIGSAKPSVEEREGIPHFGFDICDPDQAFSAADFQQFGRSVIRDIQSRGKTPIVVGGTGLYVEALLYPITLGEVPGSEAIRETIRQKINKSGLSAVYDELVIKDPMCRTRIHPNDQVRIVRALEVLELTGKPLPPGRSEYLKGPTVFPCIMAAISWQRDQLYERIDKRVDLMMKNGLMDEVLRLKKEGCTQDMQSMKGLGYRQLLEAIEGRTTVEEAVRRTKIETCRFSKRQTTWFRADPKMGWFERDRYDSEEELTQAILEAYKKRL